MRVFLRFWRAKSEKYTAGARILRFWRAKSEKYTAGARIFSKVHRACFEVLVWGLGLRMTLRPPASPERCLGTGPITRAGSTTGPEPGARDGPRPQPGPGTGPRAGLRPWLAP